jgi:hypothetical protein
LNHLENSSPKEQVSARESAGATTRRPGRIRSPDAIREDEPNVVLMLPSDLKEIVEQLNFTREWGRRLRCAHQRSSSNHEVDREEL